MKALDNLSVEALLRDEGLGVELTTAAGRHGLARTIEGTRIQKSGLALAGHFHGIEANRIQILGKTELTYLKNLSKERCHETLDRFFDRDLCCVVVTESQSAMDPDSAARRALISCADATDTPLLLSAERSSKTITALHALLDERLAPRARIHGVLVDVYEVGLLLLGSSGVGKSELALELVMRGHRLVADDVVECMYRPPGMVFGAPADLLRHHLEVRGLGVLNIKDLFGVTAIRERKRIDVVVELVDADKASDADRLGLEPRFYEILGVDVPELLIPVRLGRDMASILEIAARNELLKAAGHHAGREFLSRIDGALLNAESEIPLSSSSPPTPRGRARRSQRPPESSVGLPSRQSSRKR